MKVQEIDAKDRELSTTREELDSARRDLTTTSADKESFESQLRVELESARADVSSRDEELRSLRQRLAEHDEALSAREAASGDVTEKIATLENELAAATRRATELESGLAEAREATARAEEAARQATERAEEAAREAMERAERSAAQPTDAPVAGANGDAALGELQAEIAPARDSPGADGAAGPPSLCRSGERAGGAAVRERARRRAPDLGRQRPSPHRACHRPGTGPSRGRRHQGAPCRDHPREEGCGYLAGGRGRSRGGEQLRRSRGRRSQPPHTTDPSGGQ